MKDENKKLMKIFLRAARLATSGASDDRNEEILGVYIYDAISFLKIADLLRKDSSKKAGDKYNGLDTAAREYVYSVCSPVQAKRMDEWEHNNYLGV